MLRILSTTIVCLLILSITAPSQAKLGFPDKAVRDNFALVEQLFSYSGATLKEIKLKHWGQISNKRESLPELETKYLVLVKKLGLDPAKKTVQIDRDGFTILSHLEIPSGETIQIFIQSMPVQGSEGATYWGFSIETIDLKQARRYYELLKAAFRELEYPEEPGIEFCGKFPASMPADKQARCLQDLVNKARAQYVEGIAGENLSSLSLYTREGTGWVLVQGQKVNLNLALRAITSENTTNLHIAMPLIFSDY